MDTSKMIKAYCLKTKEKNVPMHEAVITKTAKGGYMAGGHDGKGNKMAAILIWLSKATRIRVTIMANNK